MKIDWWYNIVAPSLKLERDGWKTEFDSLKVKFDNQISTILNLQAFKTSLLKTNAELQERITEFIAARGRGEMGCVLTAREHATGQRIRELEALNSQLYTECDRLRARLAKFNQR